MVRASKVSQQKSPAEFFAENKTIAGFDTPAKSLYTSVRELVENSLDAAERVGVLPDVSVTLEEISLERFQKVSACSHARSSRSAEEYVVLTPAIYNHTKTHTNPWVLAVRCRGLGAGG